GTGIDPVANRDQAFGILRGCLYGIGALRERTMAQMNTSNSFRNPSIAHNYANTAGNNIVTVGLSPDLEDDAERISTEQPLADLFEILEQIEMRRAEKKLELVSKIPQSSYKLSSKLITPTQSQFQSKIKKEKAKLQARNPFKPCKRDQKETPNSGKSRNKSTIIDKSFQRVVLDMLDGIASVDWIEKLKAKIGTNMPAHVESLFTSAPPIQKSNF
ncbi:7381_t:CDS:2, partial [Dentiscutata heterogama]